MPDEPDVRPSASREGELTLLRVATILLRRRRLIGVVAFALFVMVVGATVVGGADHRAESRFVPHAVDDRSRASGLAAQFGLNLGGVGSLAESPEFYRQLLGARDLLRAAVLADYTVPAAGHPNGTLGGTLLDVLAIDGPTETARVAAGIEALRRMMNTSVDWESGVVTLRTTAGSPPLAEQVNRRLLDLMDEFNRERRRSRAREERRFIEERIEEARTELDAAESDMERFLEQNRRYLDSPQLTFEFARLQRRVDLRQQVYISLAQSYEQARIDEVRNTPVVSIIAAPEESAVRLSRGLASRGVLALVIGFILGSALALGWDRFVGRREEGDDELAAFLALGREALAGLTPGRVLGRGRVPRPHGSVAADEPGD